MPQHRDDERPVPTRRISFEDALSAVPKHFAYGGDLVLSHVAAALSSVFPDGEDFFVCSVRHFRDEIDDPRLKRQVAGFIGQEAMRGREHRAFNRRLAEVGYPTLQLEASEHKAVAFDLYRAVGGTERMRTSTMNMVTVGFVAGICLGVAVSLAGDPAARQPRALAASLRRLWRSPLVSRSLWRPLREYNRPGFHPDDRDASALVERWRGELFGPEGTLTDRLAGAAA